MLDPQADHFLVGPDIDADGYQDIFVASLWGGYCDLYVDALSGKGGHRLWSTWRRQPRSGDAPNRYLRRLGWWSEDRDGWPRLLVSVGAAVRKGDASWAAIRRDHVFDFHVIAPERREGASSLVAFSAATGKLVHEVEPFEQFELADLDGDRRQELLRYYPQDAMQFDKGGTLDAFRGSTGERWRWLGGDWHPTIDIDGDGLRDLMSLSDQAGLRALSGSTGRILWANHIDGVGLGQITSCEDLDGDSSADFLLWTGTRRGARLRALSSKNGHVLWTATFEDVRTEPAARLTAADLDGDRKPEVILAADMEGFWLAVLSGANGSVRWKKRHLSNSHNITGLHETRDPIVAADFWDLNGDGTRDIVVLAPPGGDDTKLSLYAIDGARGSVLWEHPTHGSPAPVALAADLDGNGKPEVYLLECEIVTGLHEWPESAIARLVALNAGDGQTRWTWETSGNYGPDDFLAYPKPQVLRRAGGQSWLCLNLWGFSRPRNAGEIICLDMHGKLLNRIPVTSRLERRAFRLWTDDLTGDGDGDLLFMSGDKLRVAHPEDGTSIWESTLQIDSGNEVLGVLSSPRGQPEVVVREAVPPCKVYGLDGGTAELRWSCALPSTSGAVSPANTDQLTIGESKLWRDAIARDLSSVNVLDVVSGDEPPTIQYRYGETTIGWQARFVEQSEAAGRPAAIVEQVAARADPRLARPLPWRQFVSAAGGWRAAGGLVAWAMLYCLGLILLPGAAGWWLVSRRRWGLRTLALLHLVAAVFLSAWLLDGPDNELLSRLGKFGSGAMALPVVLALVFIGRWAVARRWRTLLAWLVISVILAVAIGALCLWADGSQRAEDQYYSLDGWYGVWLPAAYATAVIVALAGVARLAWRWYGRRRRLRNA